MERSQIGRARLINQRINGPKFDTAAEVVRWMGGMQAQDYHGTLWSIALRMKSGRVADVEAAIEHGDIVRTWPMRGTIHFVPPEDAHWMLGLMASRILAKDDRRLEQLELTRDQMDRCGDILRNALQGGKRLARPDVLALLEENGMSMEGQRGYHTLWYLSQAGTLCIGPMEGKQQTFVLLDEWVTQQRTLSRDDALGELAWRFFNSHGPATLDDFVRWTGLTKSDCRAALDSRKSALVALQFNDQEYWTPRHIEDETPEHVYLLPGFDEFVLGYKDRSMVLEDDHAEKISPGKNGVFYPTIVIDGQIVGTWKRNIKSQGVEIMLSPFAGLGSTQQAVISKTEDYAAFLGMPVLSVNIE